MSASISDLKRNYKMNLALGRVLPTHDLATPLPLSTGHPLYDAALTDKLQTTSTLSESEHLNRAWHLVRQSTRDERSTLARHTRGLLNDYKMLLALQSWQAGEEELTRTFLNSMPWHWRLAFPIAVLKPAEHFFTGWRRSLRFRLVETPRYPALRALFSELLAQAPGVAILKYRQTIKAAAALQRYRFTGEREQAIHDLCFTNGHRSNGRSSSLITPVSDLEPIGAYLLARQALNRDDLTGFLDILQNGRAEIPITTYMGLLGNAGIRLTNNQQPAIDALREYALRCATPVESLLRLQEWGSWLNARQAEILGQKVQHGIIERDLNIPFFKVTKAFMNAPLRVRKLTVEPLYLPLLRHFGSQLSSMLPEPGPLTFLQPGNVIHIMSFLLYTVLSTAMPTRLFLLYKDGMEEIPPLDIDEVAAHLADKPKEMERWFLNTFGGLGAVHGYTYDYPAVSHVLRELNPEAPLMLDLPFVESMDVLAALIPFSRVFNLNTTFGAPGEICIAYEYYAEFSINTPYWYYRLWSRYSDSAAQRFAEFLDRLRYFQQLAAEVSP
ncbi:MAG: hypothetical protein WAM60_13260 [Candidatus Promineifilaceae bacterium]